MKRVKASPTMAGGAGCRVGAIAGDARPVFRGLRAGAGFAEAGEGLRPGCFDARSH